MENLKKTKLQMLDEIMFMSFFSSMESQFLFPLSTMSHFFPLKAE